jgi:hypothetical protein
MFLGDEHYTNLLQVEFRQRQANSNYIILPLCSSTTHTGHVLYNWHNGCLKRNSVCYCVRMQSYLAAIVSVCRDTVSLCEWCVRAWPFNLPAVTVELGHYLESGVIAQMQWGLECVRVCTPCMWPCAFVSKCYDCKCTHWLFVVIVSTWHLQYVCMHIELSVGLCVDTFMFKWRCLSEGRAWGRGGLSACDRRDAGCPAVSVAAVPVAGSLRRHKVILCFLAWSASAGGEQSGILSFQLADAHKADHCEWTANLRV